MIVLSSGNPIGEEGK